MYQRAVTLGVGSKAAGQPPQRKGYQMASNATTTATTTATKGGKLRWGQPGQPGVTVHPNGKAHSATGAGGTFSITRNANASFNLAHMPAAKGSKGKVLVQGGTYAACYLAAVAANKAAAAKAAKAASAAASRKAAKAQAASAPAA